MCVTSTLRLGLFADNVPAIMASEPSPAMTALKRARKGKSHDRASVKPWLTWMNAQNAAFSKVTLATAYRTTKAQLRPRESFVRQFLRVKHICDVVLPAS